VKLFKNSKFEFMRAFDRTPCEQKFRKTHITVADTVPYVLGHLSVPDDVPSLYAIEPPLEKPGPRPVDREKVPPLPP
jgi:hypothetical protein